MSHAQAHPHVHVHIHRVASVKERSLPVFAEADRIFERVQQRAFDLFAARGFGDGRALEDWLSAEHEVCGPAAKLVETQNEYVVGIALPGFEPGEIDLIATPRELIVHARSRHERANMDKGGEGNVPWSEFLSNNVYRRIEFPADVRVNDVMTTSKNGLLTIVAPKAKVTSKPAAVTAAA
jgi:HSP20 family molecular chaperone IbpA